MGEGAWRLVDPELLSLSREHEGRKCIINRAVKETHSFHPSRQYPFGRGRDVAPVSLKIPQEGPPVDLWEHLLYSFDGLLPGTNRRLGIPRSALSRRLRGKE